MIIKVEEQEGTTRGFWSARGHREHNGPAVRTNEEAEYRSINLICISNIEKKEKADTIDPQISVNT